MIKNNIRFFVFLLCIGVFNASSAQELEEKQLEKIELAEGFLKNSNFLKAKKTVDELYDAGDLVEVHGNRFYYLRGRVYSDIVFQKNPKNRTLKHIQLASSSYQLVINNKDPKNKYLELANARLNNFWGKLINKGISAYSNLNNEKAMFFFMGAQKVMPTDTLGYIYAGVIAEQLNDWALVYENFNELIKLDCHNPDVYSTLSYIEENVNSNLDKALFYTQNGLKHNPNFNDLILNEVNLLIRLDRNDEAKSKIKSFLKKQPNNVNLHYDLAYLYENTGDLKKAKKYYKETLVLDPNHQNTLYNMAVIHYNEAAASFKSVFDMDENTRNKKGKKISDKADLTLRESLNYFEQYHKLNETDMVAINAMYKIYVRLGMTEEASQFESYIEE